MKSKTLLPAALLAFLYIAGLASAIATPTLVRVTDAHPAGTYAVTVTAFDNAGATTTRTFTLAVTTPSTCNPVSFATASDFGTGSSPAFVLVGDFNGDGRQDLAVANGGSNDVSILLDDGAGNFSVPTNFAVGDAPISIAAGDFNGDGKEDLAVANYAFASSSVSILLGDGAGNFSVATNINVGYGYSPRSVAVGDFNGDGKQDLVTANASSLANNVSIMLGDGAGNFSAPTV
jgi:hypothetical protein